MIEDLIRDNLAQSLDILEPNLVLIQKEFYLKNAIGSKGFVDILAKDRYNNFVIIEIKRSRESSRQTIQEILKYISLIKQNFNAKDSEIRTIIVSTNWEELLAPFSELIVQTSLTIKGIKLYVNTSHFPTRAEIVQPLPPKFINRNIVPVYKFDLFKTEEKRNFAIGQLEQKCSRLGVKDYLFVLLDGTKARNPNVIFPYTAMFAYQELPLQVQLEMLKHSEELDMTADDFDSPEDFKNYLDEIIIAELKSYEHNDDGESGSPERLEAILKVENWSVQSIRKYGFYKEDPRNDDDSLLRELRGLNGNNEAIFMNFCESSHKDRLQEIIQQSLRPIADNSVWNEHISNVYTYLESVGKAYRLVVNVFSPLSLLDSIIRVFNKQQYEYLPVYIIYADFLEENNLKVFYGGIVWNGSTVNTNDVMDYLRDDRNSLMTKFIDCIMLGENQGKLIKMLKLTYDNSFYTIEAGQIEEKSKIKIYKSEIQALTNQNKSVEEWVLANQELGRQLLEMARAQTNDFY